MYKTINAPSAFAESTSLINKILLILAGGIVLAASGRAAIPVPGFPVPFSIQTLAVMLIGAFLGWRLSVMSVVIWLIAGALGAPVFANGGGGLSHLFGPTAGYLFSYPIMAGLVGWLTVRGWNGSRPALAFLAMIIATAICLSMGAVWLGITLGAGTALGGLALPFLTACTIKSAIGAGTLYVCSALRKIRNAAPILAEKEDNLQ